MQNTSWLRFSLAGLLGMSVFVAVGAAALAYASYLWASAFFTAAVAALLVGALMIFFRRGRARAFWIGFVMFGGVYLALVFGPWLADNIGPQLLTTKLLEFVHQKLPAPKPPPTQPGAIENVIGVAGSNSDGWYDIVVQPAQPTPYPGYYTPSTTAPPNLSSPVYPPPAYAPFRTVQVVVARPPWDAVQRIGHSWLAIIVALIGGAIGRALFDGQQREREEGAAG